MCGEEPFKGENEQDLYKKIFKGQYDKDSESYYNLSANAKDFLLKFLVIDPKKRLSAHQALSNDWLQGKATRFDNLGSTIDTMRSIIMKKKTDAFLNKQALKSKSSKPSLSQKYLPKDCWLWLQKSTKYGTSLVDCVRPAVENPDSAIGLVAPDPDCYDIFPEIFYPVISDYHKVDVFSLKFEHNYGNPREILDFEPKYSDSIVFLRVCLGRTLKGFPMGPKLSRETRELIKNEMLNSFKDLNGEYYGDYFELSELSDQEIESYVKSHYLFNNADDKYLRSAGAYSDW